jgi:hypothetical protein
MELQVDIQQGVSTRTIKTERTMSDEEKDKLVEEVMNGFDFEQVYCIEYLREMESEKWHTIDELKETAEKFLRMALEHQDREFWWAGGLNGHGGLCACYDDKWGLSLNYIAVAKKVRIKKDEQ